MPISVKMDIYNSDEESLHCYLCEEKLNHGERHIHWGVQFEKEFVQCSFHRAPTKSKVGLTALYSYGFKDTFQFHKDDILVYRISQVNRRGKILNPATPSYISTTQILELFENPTIEVVTRLIEENLHENKYWKDKAAEELKAKEVKTGDDGIRRGIRVLGLERNCDECGVSEAEMITKNPRYTLCRGVCVVCYRKLFRKKNTHDK